MFDEPNLVSAAGLVPVLGLAGRCGLQELADRYLSVPTDKGAHPGAKVASLVAGMVAGADSIDDMALLRHGAMGKVFDRPYAPGKWTARQVLIHLAQTELALGTRTRFIT